MWWVIGTVVASFIMLFCFCSCVLAGKADDKINEWMSREEAAPMKSIPSMGDLGDLQYSRGSGVYCPPELSTLPLVGSSLEGFGKKISEVNSNLARSKRQGPHGD